MLKTKYEQPKTNSITPKLYTLSKKKFKAGLESLFGEPVIGGMSPFLVEKQEVAVKERENVTPKEEKRKVTTRRVKRRSSSKNFTSDLETLFSDALDKEQSNQQKKKTSTTITKKPTKKPVIGLDALIRKTSEGNYETKYASTPLKKRLTITMERKKLEQLKTIAREKKAYLRDIIDELVSEYLSQIKTESAN